MRWRTGAAALAFCLTGMITAGCDRQSEILAQDVNLPAVLQSPDELPLGSANMRLFNRSTMAALDALAPRWDDLSRRSYILPAGDIAGFRSQLASGMPEGWERVDVAFPAERGELIVYAAGEQVFAVVIASLPNSPVLPVEVMHSRRS